MMAVVQRKIVPAPAPTNDENPRAVIGDNRPPIDVEARAAFDAVLDSKAGFRDRIASLIAAADRATATDEESAGRCGELVKQIRAASKFVEDAHTTTKAPYLLAGRAVDAAKNEQVGPLATAKTKVEAKQATFLREEEAKRQAKLRREREAEEVRRREEYDRQQKLAAALTAAEPSSPPVEVAPPAPVFIPEPERQVIRGDYGAAVSGKRIWLSQVEDYEVAFMAVSNNSKVREAIDTAIKAMVRGGVHQIEGVKIWSDVGVSNR